MLPRCLAARAAAFLRLNSSNCSSIELRITTEAANNVSVHCIVRNQASCYFVLGI